MIFKKSTKLNTLEDCLALSWKMLDSGVRDFRHPFRCPVLVTEKENQPDARTVILRDFSKEKQILVCHSDVRSSKIDQIQNNPRVSWLFYDPQLKFQVRVLGTASVHTDDHIAKDLWNTIRSTYRINYCTSLPPGSALNRPSSGLPDFMAHTAPHLLDKNAGRKNFAVIQCRFNMIDTLLLGVTGHKRAKFFWEDNKLSSTWVVP